jgi:hypothetical protein
MSDTFKSGQWRICAHCLGTIQPKDRATYIADEIACMECLTAEEERALAEHSELSQELDMKESELMAAYEALRISNQEEMEQAE